MSRAVDRVHGAWARRSVSIAGGPHFETQHVVWLQAGTCYADIRVGFCPGADTRVFAGRSGWDADGYRWTHHLDLETGAPSTTDDVGHLTWEGDALVERGLFPTAGAPVAYEEIWVPLGGGGGSYLAREAADACLVRVGTHTITVVDSRSLGGAFAASYSRWSGQSWEVVLGVGPVASLPRPDDDVPWPVIDQSGSQTMEAGVPA